MSDFEKVSGGACAKLGIISPVRSAYKYRNKAGVEHVMDIIENTQNNTDSLGRITNIRDYLSSVGEILEKDEMSLADVSGGASLEAINDRRFDSIWKQKDPRKILRLFKNTDGSINLEAAAASSDRASIVRDILKELPRNDREKLLLAGILLTDDSLEVQEFLDGCWEKKLKMK